MDFVVVTPVRMHQSAGVRALHILADELTARGHTASCDLLSEAKPKHIAIYPEVVSGNPCKAPHVVRWVLNTPGLLGGDTEYADSEYVVTWDTQYTDAPLLTVDTIERDLFHAGGSPKRTHDAAYYGKGDTRGVERQPLTMHLPEIRRDWPQTRADVADFLRHTRTLHTYDDHTMLTTEAMLCGCNVVLQPEGRAYTWNDIVTDAPHAERIDAMVAECEKRWGIPSTG